MRLFRTMLSIAVVVAVCFNITGCGKRDDSSAKDFSSLSDKAATRLIRALVDEGVLDDRSASAARVQRVTSASEVQGVSLEWNLRIVGAPEWLFDQKALSVVVETVARRAPAKIMEELYWPGGVTYRFGFISKDLGKYASVIEIMRVDIPLMNAVAAQSGADFPEWLSQAGGQQYLVEPPIESSDGGWLQGVTGERVDSPGLEPVPEPVVEPIGYDQSEARPASAENRQAAEALPPAGPTGARLAIIIDDLGSGARGTEELFKVNAPLTVSVLPYGRHAAREAQIAIEKGFAVLMHQPMEPLDSGKRPGAGAITMGMNEAQIKQVISDNLKAVPGAMGVNNHMGSRVTQDARSVEAILREVNGRGLFFVDSRTSSSSVVAKVAGSIGTSVLENGRFLDGVDDEEYVVAQLRTVARVALSKGHAVAIGHVRPATVRAIQRMIPELNDAGVTLVTVDTLAQPVPMALRKPAKAQPKEAAAPVSVPVPSPVPSAPVAGSTVPGLQRAPGSPTVLEPSPQQDTAPQHDTAQGAVSNETPNAAEPAAPSAGIDPGAAPAPDTPGATGTPAESDPSVVESGSTAGSEPEPASEGASSSGESD